jgi:alginate O-acetyltransferase complex protein AlgF
MIRITAIVTLTLTVFTSASAQNSGLGGLYATQPPAGSAFVRVINASGAPGKIELGKVRANLPASGTGQLATVYAVVDTEHPLTMTVNGVPLSGADKFVSGSFYSLIIYDQTALSKIKTLTDKIAGQNALKVVLRAYNLIPGCQMRVSLPNATVVFDQISADDSKVRLINPVKATLLARCEQGESSILTLPALNAGDKFSVFLTGDKNRPQLSGQIDQTEAF